MALDYSKLSDEELQAIADGNYSKLNDSTLQQLASESAPAAGPVAPAEPYVTQDEADRNELMGLGALGAGALGAGALAYKYSPAIQAGKKVIDFVRNPITQQVAGKVMDVAKNVMTPTAPVAPTPTPAAPATSPILDAQGRPMTRPVAPTPTPAPAAQPAQPGIMDKASQVVRQIAANRVVQGVARAGAGLTAAVTPGNVGQNYPFPTSGPLRGSEINPATGRPWTPQELAQYRAQYGG